MPKPEVLVRRGAVRPKEQPGRPKERGQAYLAVKPLPSERYGKKSGQEGLGRATA